VTVPRIPSTTSTILSGIPGTHHKTGSVSSSSGRTSPQWLEELESANAEIVRLTSEIEIFALRLTEETARRKSAEASWRAAEQHMLDLETEIREECFAEMEAAVEAERRRWQAAWDAEADSQEMHLDRKIDVVIQATRAQTRAELRRQQEEVKVFEDPEPALQDRVEELEGENRDLRRRLEAMERELQGRTASPVKKQRVLKAKRWEDPDATLRLGGED
jgi:chromosome segregation ATPase